MDTSLNDPAWTASLDALPERKAVRYREVQRRTCAAVDPTEGKKESTFARPTENKGEIYKNLKRRPICRLPLLDLKAQDAHCEGRIFAQSPKVME